MGDDNTKDAPVPKPDEATANIPQERTDTALKGAATASQLSGPDISVAAKAATPVADEAPSKSALKSAPASAAPVQKAIAKDRVKPSRLKAKKSVTQTKSAASAKKAKAATKTDLPVARKSAPRKVAAVKKAAPAKPTPATGKTTYTKNSETNIMAANAETMKKNVANTMGEMSTRTKSALEKSTTMLSEAGDFAKGNVEAMVESNKILASGLQDMSREALAESKSEFEALTAELKEMASVKSPTDFFQMQSAFMRKQFDKAVARSSKNTEAMLKLANEASQPLSNRMSVAMEKAKVA